jgi:hypothetical protein
MISAADRAAITRRDIERLLRLYRSNPLPVLLDIVEDRFEEELLAHERAVRRECADREPAYLSNSDSE